MKKVIIQCKCCEAFHLATRREMRENEKRGLTQYRLCNKTNEFVKAKTEACSEMELSQYFWCIKDANWILAEGCMSRQEKKREGCVRCKQGRDVKKIYDEVKK